MNKKRLIPSIILMISCSVMCLVGLVYLSSLVGTREYPEVPNPLGDAEYVSGVISGNISGVFFAENVTIENATISKSYIRASGRILFRGHVVIEDSAIVSGENVTVVLENTTLVMVNSYIYSRGSICLDIYMTNITGTERSFIESWGIIVNIENMDNIFWSHVAILSYRWNIVNIVNCEDIVINDAWGNIGSFYTSLSYVIRDSKNISVVGYRGSSLEFNIHNSTVTIANIHAVKDYTPLNLSVRESTVMLLDSNVSSLSFEINNGSIEVSNVAIFYELDINPSIRYVSFKDTFLRDGRLYCYVDDEYVHIEDAEDYTVAIYNVSLLSIQDSSIKMLTGSHVGNIEILNSIIGILEIDLFRDAEIQDVAMNKTTITNSTNITLSNISSKSVVLRNINMTYLEGVKTQKLRIYNASSTQIYDSLIHPFRPVPKYVFSGMGIMVHSERLEIENTKARVHAVVIDSEYVDISDSELNCTVFYFLREPSFLHIDELYSSGRRTIYVTDAESTTIDASYSPCIIHNCDNITVDRARGFVVVIGSEDVRVEDSSCFINIFSSRDIDIYHSDINSTVIINTARISIHMSYVCRQTIIINSSQVEYSKVFFDYLSLLIKNCTDVSFVDIGIAETSGGRFLMFDRYIGGICIENSSNVVFDGVRMLPEESSNRVRLEAEDSTHIRLSNIEFNLYCFATYFTNCSNIVMRNIHAMKPAIYLEIWIYDSSGITIEELYVDSTEEEIHLVMKEANNFKVRRCELYSLALHYCSNGVVEGVEIYYYMWIRRSWDLVVVRKVMLMGEGLILRITEDEYRTIEFTDIKYMYKDVLILSGVRGRTIRYATYGEIIVINSEDIRIEHSTMGGLYIDNCINIALEDANAIFASFYNIDGLKISSLDIYAGDHNFLELYNISGLIMRDCYIRTDVLTSKCNDVVMKDNIFQRVRGLRIVSFSGFTNAEFLDNTFSGVFIVMSGLNITFMRNSLRDLTPCGICLEGGKYIVIRENIFERCGVKKSGLVRGGRAALYLYSCRNVFVYRNTFKQNHRPLVILNSYGIFFSQNNFISNAENYTVENSVCEFSVAGYGNYWGDIGVDRDGDMIYDEPYVSGDIVDPHPLAYRVRTKSILISRVILIKAAWIMAMVAAIAGSTIAGYHISIRTDKKFFHMALVMGMVLVLVSAITSPLIVFIYYATYKVPWIGLILYFVFIIAGFVIPTYLGHELYRAYISQQSEPSKSYSPLVVTRMLLRMPRLAGLLLVTEFITVFLVCIRLEGMATDFIMSSFSFIAFSMIYAYYLIKKHEKGKEEYESIYIYTILYCLLVLWAVFTLQEAILGTVYLICLCVIGLYMGHLCSIYRQL